MGMGGSADVASNGTAAMAKQADAGKREVKPAWTKIYGKTLDVSKFRHPGGNIIELFYGMDATTAFEAFHGHHKGAFNLHKTMACYLRVLNATFGIDDMDARVTPDDAEHLTDLWLLQRLLHHPLRRRVERGRRLV